MQVVQPPRLDSGLAPPWRSLCAVRCALWLALSLSLSLCRPPSRGRPVLASAPLPAPSLSPEVGGPEGWDHPPGLLRPSSSLEGHPNPSTTLAASPSPQILPRVPPEDGLRAGLGTRCPGEGEERPSEVSLTCSLRCARPYRTQPIIHTHTDSEVRGAVVDVVVVNTVNYRVAASRLQGNIRAHPCVPFLVSNTVPVFQPAQTASLHPTLRCPPLGPPPPGDRSLFDRQPSVTDLQTSSNISCFTNICFPNPQSTTCQNPSYSRAPSKATAGEWLCLLPEERRRSWHGIHR